MLRSDPGYLRQKTKERDKGVCGECGTDTEAIKTSYRQLATVAREGINAYECLKKKAFKRHGVDERRWWKITNEPTRATCLTTVERHRREAIRIWEHNRKFVTDRNREFQDPHPDECPRRAARWRSMLEDAVELTPTDTRLLAIHKRLISLAETRRKRIAAELEAAGFRGSVSRLKLTNLWQADHIHPVAEGGGSCGLENIQTLCSSCHKRKTADQARRKSLLRRGIDPDAPPIPDHQATLNL